MTNLCPGSRVSIRRPPQRNALVLTTWVIARASYLGGLVNFLVRIWWLLFNTSHYLRAVYIPYLDDFCNSLKERFESHKETIASLQHILPEFCTKTDFYSLEAAFNFYEEELSHKKVVQSEFMLWKEKWSQEKSENLPKTAISSLENCDKTFFPNIYILLKLLAVLPVSFATVEKSF
ncbi:hypothetical protein AVEN_111048-1 [Araneus ventricosus]|uniref:HAT C-terminal dimerisation domain-containing protein n=1 Tax=Araneus ventricosus TaxID=182803 RepID=A0A4Y2DM26_ARAVE|nr:hypothetical protein AVEN_111048-1 [Araneus ventricosus]